MFHPKSPKSQEVLDCLKDLKKEGTVAYENGMVICQLDNDWIFNSLAVLEPYGFIRPPFFVYPPRPIGAHIKIVTKAEAEDYELCEKDVSHLIGKTVKFEVVRSYVSHPRKRSYGVEANYKIRIESPKLSQIREELTGLSSGPNSGHFVILVGLRNPALNVEMKVEMNEEEEEEKFRPV